MANYLKGIGDINTGKNEILPSFDAKILRYITQNTAGIAWTEANKFAVTVIDRGVLVGAGMCQAFGYFGMADSPTQLNFVYPSGSAQYARVYAEINLSITPHQFEVKATPQSTTSNIPLLQDDLSSMPSGIYQVPLYLLTINSNSTITYTDQRPQNTKPEYAKNAENSTQATNANNVVSGGTVASNVVGTTQAQSDNTTKLATTAYVRTAIANATNITSGTVSFASGFSADSNFVKRQMNFVYGQIIGLKNATATSANRTLTIGNLSANFRPKTDVPIGVQIWQQTSGSNLLGIATSSDAEGKITSNGDIVITLYAWQMINNSHNMGAYRVYFGYEIT